MTLGNLGAVLLLAAGLVEVICFSDWFVGLGSVIIEVVGFGTLLCAGVQGFPIDLFLQFFRFAFGVLAGYGSRGLRVIGGLMEKSVILRGVLLGGGSVGETKVFRRRWLISGKARPHPRHSTHMNVLSVFRRAGGLSETGGGLGEQGGWGCFRLVVPWGASLTFCFLPLPPCVLIPLFPVPFLTLSTISPGLRNEKAILAS